MEEEGGGEATVELTRRMTGRRDRNGVVSVRTESWGVRVAGLRPRGRMTGWVRRGNRKTVRTAERTEWIDWSDVCRLGYSGPDGKSVEELVGGGIGGMAAVEASVKEETQGVCYTGLRRDF